MAIEIADGVFWVGAKDFALRDFHSYETSLGTTYNAYLVKGQRIALVDTVKTTHTDQLFRRIQAVVPVNQIDYIVVNHNELDHMGSLELVARASPDAVIVGNKKAIQGVLKHFPGLADREFLEVKTGDTLDLGEGLSLAFYQIPMVHWPESMASYVPELGLLMPNDAFGQHYATEAFFDHQAPFGRLMRELQKYYASIVDLLNPGPVRKAVEAVRSLDPKIIAPSHGVIWKEHVEDVLLAYEKWVSGTTEPRATLVYDTMYGSTAIMARVIEEAFEQEGVPISVYKASVSDPQEILADAMMSRAIIVGGPTMNNNLYPPVSFFLAYLKQMAKRDRKGMVFGSFGWAGGAHKQVIPVLEERGIAVEDRVWTVKFRPDGQEVQEGFDMARRLARDVKA